MRPRNLLAIVLVTLSACRERTTSGLATARAFDYGFVKNGAHFLGNRQPEHWAFTNAPIIWETNQDRLTESVNQCLTAVGLPTVTNYGVRGGRISELSGGWIFYRWSDYPLGVLKVRFVEDYYCQPGQLRVSVLFNPEAKTN